MLWKVVLKFILTSQRLIVKQGSFSESSHIFGRIQGEARGREGKNGNWFPGTL